MPRIFVFWEKCRGRSSRCRAFRRCPPSTAGGPSTSTRSSRASRSASRRQAERRSRFCTGEEDDFGATPSGGTPFSDSPRRGPWREKPWQRRRWEATRAPARSRSAVRRRSPSSAASTSSDMPRSGRGAGGRTSAESKRTSFPLSGIVRLGRSGGSKCARSSSPSRIAVLESKPTGPSLSCAGSSTGESPSTLLSATPAL